MVVSSPGQFQQSTQHRVVINVTGGDDMLIQLKVFFRDKLLPWWVILHETMTEMVDGIKVDGHEIPWLVLDEPGGARLNGGPVRDDLNAGGKPLIFVLIDFRAERDKRQHMFFFQFLRMQSQLG